MAETTIRTRFPLVEPDASVLPQPEAPVQETKLTPERWKQLNASMVADVERITDATIPEKCRECCDFGICALIIVLR